MGKMGMASSDTVGSLRGQFKLMDEDGSGSLDLDDVRLLQERIGQPNLSAKLCGISEKPSGSSGSANGGASEAGGQNVDSGENSNRQENATSSSFIQILPGAPNSPKVNLRLTQN